MICLAMYVKSPNLPKNKIKWCCLSGEKTEIVQGIKNLGINTIVTQKDERLAPAVSHHADMLIHHLGENKIIALDKSAEHSKKLLQMGFDITEVRDKPKALYPNDIRLNVLRIGNKAFGKLDSIDISLIEYYQKQKISLIDVSQGYAKCSAFIISKKAIITADKSVANACYNNDIDVLLIKEGNIGIDTYDYGFIGGCGGLISNDIAVLTGDVNLHPDGERMINFANKNGVRLVCLTPHNLYDIGGILPLI